MGKSNHRKYSPPDNIWIIGSGRLACSIAVCVASPGSDVVLCSDQPEKDRGRIDLHLQEWERRPTAPRSGSVSVVRSEENPSMECELVIVTGFYDKEILQSIISEVASKVSSRTAIAVATDHIPLRDLQAHSRYPHNIFVMNWTEPAHATCFLEIVGNDITESSWLDQLRHIGSDHWGKDPYLVRDEIGVRGRMRAALVREAFFLVEEGYAGIEDIDRACRNDPGTYMSFAGHFQYMDLMGTYAYGVVMKELNKELSNAKDLPEFFKELIKANKTESKEQSFYEYSKEESEGLDDKMRQYGYDIKELMEKYPFGYLEEEKVEG